MDYMSKTRWLPLVARLVCGVALFTGSLVVPAYADTITGTYTLPGNTLQGAFNFNTSADVFSGSLVFGSIFSGVSDSFNNQAGSCASGSCSFTLNTIVSGDNLSYHINLNISTDQYTASGKISNANAQMSWSYAGKGTDPPTVPESWGLSDSLGLFAFALLVFGGLTRLGVLRTVYS
jgi:hypothetical protein